MLNVLEIIEKKIFPFTKRKMKSKKGNIFGAALVKAHDNGELEIITIESNSILKNNNPLMHGEVTCLFKSFKKLNNMNLKDYILISSHEPCPMCISAIAWAGIKKVIYLFSYEDTANFFGFNEDKEFCLDIFGTEHPKSSKTMDIINLKNIQDSEMQKIISRIDNKYKKLILQYPNTNTNTNTNKE